MEVLSNRDCVSHVWILLFHWICMLDELQLSVTDKSITILKMKIPQCSTALSMYFMLHVFYIIACYMYFIIVVFQEECPTASADNNSVNEFEKNVGAPFAETGEGIALFDTPQPQVQRNFPYQMCASQFNQSSPVRKDDKVYHDSLAISPVGGLPEYVTGFHTDSHSP